MTDVNLDRAALAALRNLHATMENMDSWEESRGAALRRCVECGWNIAELSRELGVTRGTIYRWIRVNL